MPNFEGLQRATGHWEVQSKTNVIFNSSHSGVEEKILFDDYRCHQPVPYLKQDKKHMLESETSLNRGVGQERARRSFNSDNSKDIIIILGIVFIA